MRRTTRRGFGAGLAIGGAWIALPALAQQKTKVVASFTVLADLVANVGGDRIELATLVGADRDAHTYEPTPGDSRKLAGARVLVTNGLGFEPWAERLARAAPFRGRLVVATAEVPRERHLTAAHHHGQNAATDPHMFGRSRRAATSPPSPADLLRADPGGAQDYRRRAEVYDGRLAALDAWVRWQIGSVPAAKRKVITSHDAFHFGQLRRGLPRAVG